MQRLIFDYSPIYFLICLALGVGYAWLLYTVRYTWSKNLNRTLFALRMILVTALSVLLLGPVLRQTTNIFEKPALVFLIDNSRSVRETSDTTRLLADLTTAAEALRKNDWQVELSTLEGASENIQFSRGSSDLASSLKQTVNRYEGKNLAGIILVSDGIYNNGMSPLYQPLRVPVYTIGTGDTIQRSDLVLRNVAYNRVVYQGNKYPLRAEVGVNGLPNEEVTVTIRHQGTLLQQQTRNTGNRSLLDFDFQLDAVTQGIQRLEVRITKHAREFNADNNRAAAFVEVVDGKKKILLLTSSPHPDIKALRTVVEKNPNYELLVHMVGVKELPPASLNPKDIDLLIAHQSPDNLGRTTGILMNFLKAKVPTLVIIGEQTQLRSLAPSGVPLAFEASGQRDEVQPVLNAAFQDYAFSADMGSIVARYPPVSIPFGKFTFPATSKIILNQQIGNLVTERPLLLTVEQEEHKVGILVGDGLWKWRLSEFQETGKSVGFDELMSKLLQYLSTRDDRKRFRSFPIQHEFSSDGPVVIESQVYNDLFEPVYGNTIDIALKDEDGKTSNYRYITGPGAGNRYRIGGLAEGIYRYTATTVVNGKDESVKAEFLVVEQNQELRNLTADFGLLRKVAESTEGKFYTAGEMTKLTADLSAMEAKSTIHTEENFNPLINLKWFFALLLLLISGEWFLRKYAGSY